MLSTHSSAWIRHPPDEQAHSTRHVLNGEEEFVNFGGLRLWTERFGRPGDPVVLFIMGTSAKGIG